MLVMLLAGPLCGLAWSRYAAYCEWQAQQEALLKAQLQAPAPQLLVTVDTIAPMIQLPKRQQLPATDRLPMHPLEASETLPMHN
jgi:hypothetical protein